MRKPTPEIFTGVKWNHLFAELDRPVLYQLMLMTEPMNKRGETQNLNGNGPLLYLRGESCSGVLTLHGKLTPVQFSSWDELRWFIISSLALSPTDVERQPNTDITCKKQDKLSQDF